MSKKGQKKGSKDGASSKDGSKDGSKKEDKDMSFSASASDDGTASGGGMGKKEARQFLAAHFTSADKGMTYTTEQLMPVIEMSKAIFQKEGTLINLKAPVKICGDIHGQFVDLKRLFRASGRPPKDTFLFLGDYIDRGPSSLECMVLLLTMKVLFPGTMFLLRGNHECQNINRVYGFHEELQRRNLIDLFPEFNALFSWMPIAANVNQKILCMHGGISQHINQLSDIKNIQRPLLMKGKDINKIALDLLWADPNIKRPGYVKSPRGVSTEFGMDVLDQFCVKHKLDLIVRGHQCVKAGFERNEYNGKTRIVTVFSAPQYCGEMDNNAAVMTIRNNLSIKFDVLEVSSDKAYNAKRDEERKSVPMVDVYPEVEIEVDFEQLTRTVSTVYDNIKAGANKIYDDASKNIKKK